MLKLVSAFLILCFAMILAPRTIFHSHEHEHEHTSFNKLDGELSFNNDCFVCDFDLGFFTTPTPLFVSEKLAFCFKSEFVKTNAPSTEPRSVLLLRGPPQELI